MEQGYRNRNVVAVMVATTSPPTGRAFEERGPARSIGSRTLSMADRFDHQTDRSWVRGQRQ